MNTGDDWEFVESPQPAVDGGDGKPSVNGTSEDVAALEATAARTAVDTKADPLTGADLGVGKDV